MEFTVGTILEGKVKSITKFGAFILLPEGKTGLVHISEIAYSYVSDVREFLTEGQNVNVQIIEIDQNGRFNLSIKRAQPRPPVVNKTRNAQTASRQPAAEPERQRFPAEKGNMPVLGEVLSPSNDRAFEDKLKAFMSESDSKIADSHQYERKTKNRRR